MNLFLGDIHGEFHEISRLLKKYDLTDCNIIQVGDFGVGFNTFVKEKRQLSSLNDTLVRRRVNLYVIRGNHDFPDYFKSDPFNLSNIHLLDDYTVLELDNQKILFIGGAVSTDRNWRKTKNQKLGDFTIRGNEYWWPNENVVFDVDKLNQIKDIDIVVTHTCPSYCYPSLEYGLSNYIKSAITHFKDENLEQDVIEERKTLSKIFETLKQNNSIKYHFYGHFHQTALTELDSIKHRLLNINELYEIR